VRKRAHEQGYAEGLAAGRAQAEAIVAEMNTLLAAMAAPFHEAEAGLVRDLVALVERVLRQVLGRELEAGRYDLEGTLAAALRTLGSVHVPVELRLHPRDAALCREHGMASEPEITVQDDPTLTRGGVRLKAGARLVDASMEARLAEVLSALREEAGIPDPEEALPGPKAAPDSGA
jgi:flagellar assembly protein FliH